MNALLDILAKDRIKLNEPLSRYTTFGIGGPADYFVVPDNASELKALIAYCKERDIPFIILGNGSNLLVSDQGYRGMVIHFVEGENAIRIEPEGQGAVVYADAGVLLSKLSMKIADAACKGFEFAAGIPGSLGGATVMNAGAYGGEIKDALISAKVLDSEGFIKIKKKEALGLGYRTSNILERREIVLGATFYFKYDEKQAIKGRIEDLNRQRREKQPLEYRSAGSTFKRPKGYFAGKLIMDAGLRGYCVGGACVSEKHCGFVINKGGATAADVISLISFIQETVFDQFQVKLEPEVKYLGGGENGQGIVQLGV